MDPTSTTKRKANASISPSKTQRRKSNPGVSPRRSPRFGASTAATSVTPRTPPRREASSSVSITRTKKHKPRVPREKRISKKEQRILETENKQKIDGWKKKYNEKSQQCEKAESELATARADNKEYRLILTAIQEFIIAILGALLQRETSSYFKRAASSNIKAGLVDDEELQNINDLNDVANYVKEKYKEGANLQKFRNIFGFPPSVVKDIVDLLFASSQDGLQIAHSEVADHQILKFTATLNLIAKRVNLGPGVSNEGLVAFLCGKKMQASVIEERNKANRDARNRRETAPMGRRNENRELARAAFREDYPRPVMRSDFFDPTTVVKPRKKRKTHHPFGSPSFYAHV